MYRNSIRYYQLITIGILVLLLQHLLDIGSCVWLARPLVTFCCKYLASLFDLDQKLQKYQLPPVKQEQASSSQLEDVMETNEDDSVFSETPAIKQEPGKAKTPTGAAGASAEGKGGGGGRRMSVSKERKPSTSANATTAAPPAMNGGEFPPINITTPEGEPPYYHWCSHHKSVLLQLCCIVQTLAVKCPTAFITIKVLSGKGGVSRESTAKAITPLSQLPLRLFDLPMPMSLNSELQKKVHEHKHYTDQHSGNLYMCMSLWLVVCCSC